MDLEMTYEEYKKWLDIKTSLEAAGKTDSPFYYEAVSKLYRRPIPPYPKADARITKDDQI
jgi:hypothetical protein